MAHDGHVPLTGKQIKRLADGLRSAFVGFDDLARVVLPALDVPLNDIVGNPPFASQVLQLVQWAEAKGKTTDLLLAAVEEVPGNARLREAVVAVLGEEAVRDNPAVQPTLRDVVEAELAQTQDIMQALKEQVQRILDKAHMPDGPVHPQDRFSIRGDNERTAVNAILAHFRQLPSEKQRESPDLLNNLGKLQVGTGDFEGARQAFTEVARVTPDSAARAEAHYNAYRAALEQQKWDEALDALREAASLAPERFAPFPLHRYEPRRILGAGGFGTAFLCRDKHFAVDVVVKTLHTDELVRSPEEVFREARVLIQLSDPAIIGVRDCGFADPAARGRPYVVMDFFPGQSLEAYMRQHGPLSPDDLLAVAGLVARGMRAAHRCGVYHRDLKPDNVLVRNEGGAWEVKIIDFDLAMWRQGTVTVSPGGSQEESMTSPTMAGTPWFAPPEQMGRLSGVAVGPYSDVYAFGRTCCYALFWVPDPDSRQWLTVPEPLAEWLRECVSELPQDRPRDFEAVLDRLDQLPRRMGVDLAMYGRWMARPAKEPQAEWILVGQTPRRVTLLFREVYRLDVASGSTDEELESLARLRDLAALQYLDLSSCRMLTDATLAHLRGLATLQYLSLWGCERVTDAGLAHLQGLTELRLLKLGGCRLVTDAGLVHLRGLTELKMLELRGCKRVTDAGLKALQDALPKCKIGSVS
jgi:serine/threonine protein kinase